MRFPLSYAGFFAKSHILFFLRHHSDFARRSRMTAGGIAFLYDGLTCVRQLAPITSQARHFPPRSGEAYIKEERIHNFKKYYLIVAVKR